MNKKILLITILSLVLLANIADSQRPSIGGYNVYYGNFHNHSNFSDGKGTPASAYEYARKTAHMDFFSLADHCLMISPDEWNEVKKIADSTNEDGVFTTFWGFEWSSNSNYGHIAIIGTQDYCTVLQSSSNSLDELFTWLSTRDAVAFLNHPGREDAAKREFDHFSCAPSSKIVGMELWNKKHAFESFYYNDGYYSNDGTKSYFDEANSRGWKVGAAGGDDNHSATWGTVTEFRVAVLANHLTRSDIFEALKARRFYSTLDKNLALSFKINGQEMGSTIAPGPANIQIQACDGDQETFIKAKLKKCGQTIQTWEFDTASANIMHSITTKPGEYYYVLIRQKDGNEAISSPIYIAE